VPLYLNSQGSVHRAESTVTASAHKGSEERESQSHLLLISLSSVPLLWLVSALAASLWPTATLSLSTGCTFKVIECFYHRPAFWESEPHYCRAKNESTKSGRNRPQHQPSEPCLWATNVKNLEARSRSVFLNSAPRLPLPSMFPMFPSSITPDSNDQLVIKLCSGLIRSHSFELGKFLQSVESKFVFVIQYIIQ